MSDITQVLEAVKGLKENQEKLSTRLDEISKTQEDARKNGPWGAPRARSGESILTSRGFQFSRVAGVMTKKLDKDNAKVEMELCERLRKEYVERGFYTQHESGSAVVPLGSELMMTSGSGLEKLSCEVRDLTQAGVDGWDRDEAVHVLAKHYGMPVTRALSWLDESGLGALVGPPVLGEPIALLRNQEVFMRAGAQVVPFPPSGRMVWPRFTGATTAYWLGSGVNDRAITASEPTTGDLVLQVKKLGVLVKIPNELFRFPTVSVEQVIRQDMMKSAALKMDKAFLEGTGSAHEPKGIVNYDNVIQFTAGTVGVNGNTLEPEDVLEMIGSVEEKNVDFGCWVGRPLMYAALGNRRADAVAPGDKKGMFLFNVLRDGQNSSRDVTNNSVGQLEGYPFFKSNQVSNTRDKGSATNLSYVLGGQFSHYMIALSGVMEFAVTGLAETPFTQDQSWIRLITWCDGGPRYEEAFLLCDDLVVA